MNQISVLPYQPIYGLGYCKAKFRSPHSFFFHNEQGHCTEDILLLCLVSRAVSFILIPGPAFTIYLSGGDCCGFAQLTDPLAMGIHVLLPQLSVGPPGEVESSIAAYPDRDLSCVSDPPGRHPRGGKSIVPGPLCCGIHPRQERRVATYLRRCGVTNFWKSINLEWRALGDIYRLCNFVCAFPTRLS